MNVHVVITLCINGAIITIRSEPALVSQRCSNRDIYNMVSIINVLKQCIVKIIQMHRNI